MSPVGTWRVGRSYGLHVYEVGWTSPNGDRPVATFHTVADAEAAVDAVNAVLELQRAAVLDQRYENPERQAQRNQVDPPGPVSLRGVAGQT